VEDAEMRIAVRERRQAQDTVREEDKEKELEGNRK